MITLSSVEVLWLLCHPLSPWPRNLYCFPLDHRCLETGSSVRPFRVSLHLPQFPSECQSSQVLTLLLFKTPQASVQVMFPVAQTKCRKMALPFSHNPALSWTEAWVWKPLAFKDGESSPTCNFLEPETFIYPPRILGILGYDRKAYCFKFVSPKHVNRSYHQS